VLLLIGGAVAGIALTAARDRLSRTHRETVDTVPVFIVAESSGRLGVDVAEFRWTRGTSRPTLASRLGVFRSLPLPGDQLPRPLWPLAPGFTPEPERSRLLISGPTLRLYAFPTKQGQVCYQLLPDGDGACLPALLNGAWPEVRPRVDVWGLVDDGATRVEVEFRRGSEPASLGRNAFYLRLPEGVVAPRAVVVSERSGVRHRFVFERCRVSDIGPLTAAAPLGPGFC
jgi:hypothetical protein